MIKRCLRILASLPSLATLALLLGAVPYPASAAVSKYQTWRAAAAQVLAKRGDADSLATAAALRFAGAARVKSDAAAAKSAAVDLAAKASGLDPQNPGIGWLRLQLCANTPGCDIRDAATNMRWVDADNGAVWMPTLAAAQKEGNSVDIDRILQDMAQATRFDFFWNRSVVMFFDAMKRARGDFPPEYLPSDLARLSEAMLIAAAEIVPPLTPLSSVCRDSASGERRESCLKLSRIMQRADTIAAQFAGFNIEKRLSAPEGREARALAERRRLLEWRVSTASRYSEPLLPWSKNALARRRVAQMRSIAREEDLDIAILRNAKLPLEPPEARP